MRAYCVGVAPPILNCALLRLSGLGSGFAGKGRTSRVYCQAPMYYSNTLIGLFSDGELVFVTAFTVRYELSSDTSANEQPC